MLADVMTADPKAQPSHFGYYTLLVKCIQERLSTGRKSCFRLHGSQNTFPFILSKYLTDLVMSLLQVGF
jgi:hypothetical protein